MHINWLTHSFDPRDGYGNMCGILVRKLIQYGVCVTPFAMESLRWPGWLQRAAGIEFSRLTLSMTPGYNIRALPGAQWAYSMYEADRIPEEWVENFNRHTRRVIVPSDWCREVFIESGVKTPVDVILGGTDPQSFPVVQANTNSRPYTFMALGDRGSRKGWDIVWQAFFQEFKPGEDVRLIVKSRRYNMDFLSDVTGLDPRISLWRDDVPSLFDAFVFADCFVYPARADGWGMPPREAAMMGLPVIATRYSGLTHGIDEWATRVVEDFTIQTGTIPGGGSWSYSNVDEVAAHMRWCFENRDAAKAKALKGAQWLREHQTYEHSIRQLVTLMETIL